MAATTKAMTTANGSGAGAVVVAGCAACEHPGRAEIDQQLMHEVGAEVVAQSFGISPVVVEWHANRHLRGVTRRVPGDARELLVDLDYVRSKAETVAQAAAAEGKHALQLAALKEYRECTQAICKLVDAGATLANARHYVSCDDVLDALLEVVERHPDWRDEIAAALDAAVKRGTRPR